MTFDKDLNLSVIVPTCHRNDHLAECLKRLAPGAQSLNEKRYEVIVSDDGRHSTAKEMIQTRFPWAKWTAGPARGPAANRNHGAKQAQNDLLVFVDDDCLPQPQILFAYVEAFHKLPTDSLLVVIGPTYRTEEPDSLLSDAPHNPNGDQLISANFAIRLKDLQQVGWFDERYAFAYFEDTEFFDRFLNSGGKVAVAPTAAVSHPLRQTKSAQQLGRRWESRVIYAIDQGASPWTIGWRLPWHSLRVIQSRFRDQPFSLDNSRAAVRFVAEWLYVLIATPKWIYTWSRRNKSKFWTEHTAKYGSARNLGF